MLALRPPPPAFPAWFSAPASAPADCSAPSHQGRFPQLQDIRRRCLRRGRLRSSDRDRQTVSVACAFPQNTVNAAQTEWRRMNAIQHGQAEISQIRWRQQKPSHLRGRTIIWDLACRDAECSKENLNPIAGTDKGRGGMQRGGTELRAPGGRGGGGGGDGGGGGGTCSMNMVHTMVAAVAEPSSSLSTPGHPAPLGASSLPTSTSKIMAKKNAPVSVAPAATTPPLSPTARRGCTAVCLTALQKPLPLPTTLGTPLAAGRKAVAPLLRRDELANGSAAVHVGRVCGHVAELVCLGGDGGGGGEGGGGGDTPSSTAEKLPPRRMLKVGSGTAGPLPPIVSQQLGTCPKARALGSLA